MDQKQIKKLREWEEKTLSKKPTYKWALQEIKRPVKIELTRRFYGRHRSQKTNYFRNV